MTTPRQRILELSSELAPKPTGQNPLLPRLEGIRAVLFDVYGTLLISGSGDISLTSGAAHGDAAAAALEACGVAPRLDGQPVNGQQVVDQLKQVIKQHHAASQSEFPEVEIREVWPKALASCGLPTEGVDPERLAIEYECRVNPIWPMPGLAETLSAIQAAGLPLGIVSNAQFFTPPAVEAFCGASLAELGFLPELCVWSYAQREAKPGEALYRLAAERLAESGLGPSETLYIGNDMRNDIAPAAALGFRTALFAGDARSLRLRESDPLVGDRRPDAVVTELRQILTILSLADS